MYLKQKKNIVSVILWTTLTAASPENRPHFTNVFNNRTVSCNKIFYFNVTGPTVINNISTCTQYDVFMKYESGYRRSVSCAKQHEMREKGFCTKLCKIPRTDYYSQTVDVYADPGNLGDEASFKLEYGKIQN